MFQVKIFVADDHNELEMLINDFFKERRVKQRPDFLQITTGGEANYALLAAWEEE